MTTLENLVERSSFKVCIVSPSSEIGRYQDIAEGLQGEGYSVTAVAFDGNQRQYNPTEGTELILFAGYKQENVIGIHDRQKIESDNSLDYDQIKRNVDLHRAQKLMKHNLKSVWGKIVGQTMSTNVESAVTTYGSLVNFLLNQIVALPPNIQTDHLVGAAKPVFETNLAELNRLLNPNCEIIPSEQKDGLLSLKRRLELGKEILYGENSVYKKNKLVIKAV